MVSVALLAVIITVISGAIRLSYRSVDSGERKVESLERQRTSLAIIDSQIQSAFPLTHEERGVKVPYFKGGRDVLMFASNYSIWDGEKGFVQVTYRVVQNEEGKRALYASETIAGVENFRETKLLEGFDEVYFAYFLKDPGTQEPTWTGSRRDDGAMPQRIAVNLLRGSTRHSLIIPVRTGGSTAVTPVKPGFM
jgi:hypothetical protein